MKNQYILRHVGFLKFAKLSVKSSESHRGVRNSKYQALKANLVNQINLRKTLDIPEILSGNDLNLLNSQALKCLGILLPGFLLIAFSFTVTCFLHLSSHRKHSLLSSIHTIVSL